MFWISVILALLVFGGGWLWQQRPQAQPIRIGILHSLTGHMELYERPMVDALQLAIEEINQSGGLLGRRVEAIVVDCRSDATYCGQEAERLIAQEKVSALFGCWTSDCRKAVKPVVERHQHLLIFALQYEGMEHSPNIIYLGAAPNQQLVPAARWALDNLGKRFYLIGSDYVFSRTANLVMKDLIVSQGSQVLGETYVPLAGSGTKPAIKQAIADLQRLKPDVVINTVNGSANLEFFTALADSGIRAEQMPVISTSIAENFVTAMPRGMMTGHYAVWSYFQSLPEEANHRFVTAFRQRFGVQRVTNDPMEISYVGLKLWAQAVQESGTDDPVRINQSILKQSMAAPEGIVSLNKRNRHLWRNVRIGRVNAEGQFDILWSSANPICPEPYPIYRSIAAWDELLKEASLR